MAEDGRGIFSSTGDIPLGSFNFMLRVEGFYDLPCKSVKSFTKENEYEYIQEGGLNDYVHVRRKAITKPFTIQVERYAAVDYFDPMPNGAELILPLILIVSRYQDEFLGAKRTYLFTGCTVMSKEFSELDSEKSGLLTETTTIAYREMACIDLPIDMSTPDKWGFDGQNKDGNGNRSSRDPNMETNKKQGMERAKERKWPATVNAR